MPCKQINSWAIWYDVIWCDMIWFCLKNFAETPKSRADFRESLQILQDLPTLLLQPCSLGNVFGHGSAAVTPDCPAGSPPSCQATRSYGGFLSHWGTPSHHPFLDGISQEIHHPFLDTSMAMETPIEPIGIFPHKNYPFLLGMPHMDLPSCGSTGWWEKCSLIASQRLTHMQKSGLIWLEKNAMMI